MWITNKPWKTKQVQHPGKMMILVEWPVSATGYLLCSYRCDSLATCRNKKSHAEPGDGILTLLAWIVLWPGCFKSWSWHACTSKKGWRILKAVSGRSDNSQLAQVLHHIVIISLFIIILHSWFIYSFLKI
jgi:hypothetical protein